MVLGISQSSRDSSAAASRIAFSGGFHTRVHAAQRRHHRLHRTTRREFFRRPGRRELAPPLAHPVPAPRSLWVAQAVGRSGFFRALQSLRGQSVALAALARLDTLCSDDAALTWSMSAGSIKRSHSLDRLRIATAVPPAHRRQGEVGPAKTAADRAGPTDRRCFYDQAEAVAGGKSSIGPDSGRCRPSDRRRTADCRAAQEHRLLRRARAAQKSARLALDFVVSSTDSPISSR